MKEPIKLSPFKHLCMTIGNLPSSYVDSMSYYECLLWLINYLEKTVIPAINSNAEAVKEIQDWIKNLDLQDEVDNKLDEMAESGELQEIISEYLNSKAIFGFDTVADMKSATNLIDGSYARTIGYYSANDGGAGLYKIRTITNEDVVDEGSIIAMNDNTLVAELVVIENTINVKQFGAKGDGVTDDTNVIKNALKAYGNEFVKVLFPNATSYLIGGTIDLYSNTYIDLCGQTLKLNEGVYLFNNTHDNPQDIKNIKIYNGKINGSDDESYSLQLKFGLIHCNGLEVYNMEFFKCINNDHLFDLGGCSNVKIHDNYIHNGYITSGEQNKEIIQIDVASYSALPYWTESSTIYDSKACENIIIENNIFKQDDKVTNGKFNCIGTHNNVENKIHKYIKISNNKFEEPSYNVIQASRWTDVEISNNIFENGSNVSDNANDIFIPNGIVDLGDNNYNFIPYDNIKITNNFFNNADKRNNGIRHIYISGGQKNGVNYYHKDILIDGNISNGSYDRVNNLSGNDFISVSYIDNLEVSNNIVNNAKNFIYAQYNNKNVSVSNNKLNECRTIDGTGTNITNPLWNNNTSVSNNTFTMYDKNKYSYLDATTLTLNDGWSISRDWEHSICRDGNVVTLNFQLVHSGDIASDNSEITVASGVIPSEYRLPANARFMISAITNNGYSIGGVAVMQTGPNGNIQIRNNSGIAVSRFGVYVTYIRH